MLARAAKYLKRQWPAIRWFITVDTVGQFTLPVLIGLALIAFR